MPVLENPVSDPPVTSQMTITPVVCSDGTTSGSISGFVTVNRGGNVKFDLANIEFPIIHGQQTNTCVLKVSFVTWEVGTEPIGTGGGTIKVGS